MMEFLKTSSHRLGLEPARLDRAGSGIGSAFANKLANGGCPCEVGVAHGAITTADDVEAAMSYTLTFRKSVDGSKDSRGKQRTYTVTWNAEASLWLSELVEADLLTEEHELGPQQYRFSLHFGDDPKERESVSLFFYRVVEEDADDPFAELIPAMTPLVAFRNVGFVLPLSGFKLDLYQRLDPELNLSWFPGCFACIAPVSSAVPLTCNKLDPATGPEAFAVDLSAVKAALLALDLGGMAGGYDWAASRQDAADKLDDFTIAFDDEDAGVFKGSTTEFYGAMNPGPSSFLSRVWFLFGPCGTFGTMPALTSDNPSFQIFIQVLGETGNPGQAFYNEATYELTPALGTGETYSLHEPITFTLLHSNPSTSFGSTIDPLPWPETIELTPAS